MARAKPQAQRPTERSGWPAWLWLLIGGVLGAVLATIVLIRDWLPLLHGRAVPTPNPAATATHGNEPTAADHATQRPAETKPKYDFYTVLPELETVVPETELKPKPTTGPAATPSNPAADATAIAATQRYFLQTGSFRATPEAEQMKAKLALLGLRAQVVDITINGSAWHRVRVGPYASPTDLDAARRTVEANGMSGIALKEASP